LTEEGTDVFVSRIDTEEWEHDEETGGFVHLLRADDALHAGLWRPGHMAGRQIDVELVADETLLVLAGTGELRVDGGAPLTLRPGDMVSLRKGAQTSWVVDAEFREFWVYSGLP
jgi:uncharacterized cupin superfamily protein